MHSETLEPVIELVSKWILYMIYNFFKGYMHFEIIIVRIEFFAGLSLLKSPPFTIGCLTRVLHECRERIPGKDINLYPGYPLL